MDPEFTIISPMYNVARYLPEYFASLEAQTYGFDRLEVILVDDGSTDDTAVLAEAFAAQHPNVQVIRKENGGQASARNAGLAVATGTWLTFPDPDDVLSEDYFSSVAAEIDREHPQAMLSTRLLLWFDETEKVKDSHALAGRFRQGALTKNLVESPSWIQPHITSGFVRRDVVMGAGLTFPEDLRLRFEDGAFVARYLLGFDEPRITFVPPAEYLYRQRSDNTSTIQSSSGDPRKYTDTIRLGFLPVIEEAVRLRGTVPRWLQNVFLYDQFWILRSSQSPAVRNATFPASMYDELDALLPEFLAHIDEEAIEKFDLMYVAPWMRDAFLLTRRGAGHGAVYWGARDKRRGLRSIIYRFTGAAPAVTLLVESVSAEPRFSKVLDLEYVARPIVSQQTLWVPDLEDVVLHLEGEEQEILESPERVRPAFAPPPASELNVWERARRALRSRRRKARDLRRRAGRAIKRRVGRGGIRLIRRDFALHSRRLAVKYANAWVFIDRDVDANDSAEDLYWWVKNQHPEINSWFVVREGTRDWNRLKSAGARLVPYASADYYALLKHADHLASSHADRFVTNTLPKKMMPARYAFTFLQHGVIKGDISRWLNPKDIHVFVASTIDEYQYLTGPSAYRYGRKEVRLTGLPRFDVLKERADATPEEERDLVLIMPTWRDYLVGPMKADSNDREAVEDFASTPYARQISALLSDPALAVAASTGRRIVFMPHPNMQSYLDEFVIPDYVSVRSYADTDVREVLIRASLLITDYSSIAFNAAYLRTPVVYFQFDRDEYFAGHTERAGYFSYERDGFGPVVPTAAEAAALILEIIAHGSPAEYVHRMQRTFPVRDGLNRERVVQAMRDALTRRSLEELRTAAIPDSWSSAAE